jgi:hypothetical protein
LASDIAGQVGTRASFDVRDQAGRVPLHQVVQRGLLRSVVVGVDRGSIGRQLGLPADDFHTQRHNAREVVSPHGVKP